MGKVRQIKNGIKNNAKNIIIGGLALTTTGLSALVIKQRGQIESLEHEYSHLEVELLKYENPTFELAMEVMERVENNPQPGVTITHF